MNKRILVIDDEKSIRYTFESFLAEAGYEVSTARDYDEAVHLLSENEYDLIFADIVLGSRSGIDFLKEVKDRGLVCPVVMITGDPNIETAADAVRLGAFDYLSKPVRKNEMRHVAHVALQYKALKDRSEEYRANLEAIFRSVRDAIIMVDKDLAVVELNEAAKDICGVSDDIKGKQLSSMTPLCSGKCLGAVTATISTGKPAELNRIVCRDRQHNDRIVSVTTAPLLDRNGAFSGAVLVVRDETRLELLERDLKERQQFHGLIGRSRAMQQIYALIENLADVPSTVLITGESGTGKELVADAIHYRGSRSHGPLVKVNCAALSENLLESELFGHVKGAFTGAEKDKIGRFQRADGGTIFLDEIADISPRIQIRLLRVIQEMEFERVGDSTPVRVDVRVITASNQPLMEKVRNGEFREDLYYRLKVMELALPPLRDRKEDIPVLTDHFLQKFNGRFRKNIIAVTDDVRNIFMGYNWPGNVRELEHAIEHAFILCQNNLIGVEHLPREILKNPCGDSLAVEPDLEGSREAILRALEKTAWNKAKAARLLGISRRTLYRKIQEFKISLPV